jgi:hypothetical protein
MTANTPQAETGFFTSAPSSHGPQRGTDGLASVIGHGSNDSAEFVDSAGCPGAIRMTDLEFRRRGEFGSLNKDN